MIKLTRMSGTTLMINEKLIETVEETPDTVLNFINGHKYFVKEGVDEIYDKILTFEREKTADKP